MRPLTVALIATILTAPTALSAQVSASSTGNGATATVRANASLQMPVLFRVKQVAPAMVAERSSSHTEFVIRYSVATNMGWELGAEALPQGVTMLAVTGDWTNVANHELILGAGAPTNGAEVLVRVRVAAGAAPTWQDDLKLRVRGVNGVSMRVVLAE